MKTSMQKAYEEYSLPLKGVAEAEKLYAEYLDDFEDAYWPGPDLKPYSESEWLFVQIQKGEQAAYEAQYNL